MASTADQIKDIAAKVPQLVDKLPDLISGISKGNTADALGLPVDLINETLGAVGLKQHNPVAGSAYFRKLFFGEGAQTDKNIVETVGSMISAGGVASAGKAMIVGAIPKLIKEGYSAPKINQILEKVDQAELAQLNSAALDLFKETGVFKSKTDLAHKSFISDEAARLHPDVGVWDVHLDNKVGKVLSSSPQSLEKVLQHPRLYELYPELKGYPVIGDASLPMGAASIFRKTIKLGPMPSTYEMKSALLHETQHGIQDIEGFAPGGNVAAMTTKGVFSPELEQKLLRARDEGKKHADELIKLLNEKRLQAYENYLRIPGESEARFTQATQDLSGPQLKIKIAELLEAQIPQTFWSK